MEEQIDLSIIIVSWNVKDLLKKCIKSIYSQTKNISFEVFIVDNKSSDRTVEMLESAFINKPQIYSNFNLIANNYNAGFAKANNQGIEKSSGRFILLLNPDTEIIDYDTLEKCVQFMKDNNKCGVLGCKLLNSDNSLQKSVRNFPSFFSQIIVFLKIHNLWPNIKPVRKYYALDFDYSKQSEVDQMMGAFLLTRSRVIDKIGNLDENYWIWFEEVDFCKRSIGAGYTNNYLPDAKIIHHHGQSFRQVLSYKKQKQMNKSVLYYFKKHHPYFEYLTLLLLSPMSLLLALFVQILEGFRINIKKHKKVA